MKEIKISLMKAEPSCSSYISMALSYEQLNVGRIAFSPQTMDLMHLGRTSWWKEYVAEAVIHFGIGRRQSERRSPMTRCSQASISSDLLPLARPHIFKFPEPPIIAPPAGDQPLRTWASHLIIIISEIVFNILIGKWGISIQTRALMIQTEKSCCC